MKEFKQTLLRLQKNLNTLRQREARYAGSAPLDLLNQIEDHETAIALTEQTIAGELTEADWCEALEPLLVHIRDQTAAHPDWGVTVGDVEGGITGAIIAGRDITAAGDIVTGVKQTARGSNIAQATEGGTATVNDSTFDQRKQQIHGSQNNANRDININNTNFTWLFGGILILLVVAFLVFLYFVWPDADVSQNPNIPEMPSSPLASEEFSELPQPMTGDFNIAVAQFVETTSEGTEATKLANEVSQQIFNFLDSQLGPTDFGLDIAVTHKNIGPLTENSEAEQLSEQIDAHLIIYGTISVRGDQVQLEPRFFVAGRETALINTRELVGTEHLAAPVYFDRSSLRSQREANIELGTRAAILVQFIEGLVYYSTDNYQAAKLAFEQALIRSEDFAPFAGREVLYLLAAESSRKQKDYQTAHDYLDKAFLIDQEYGRAFIARGNIYYDQAIEQNFDPSFLIKSKAEYERALTAKTQPSGSYVNLKTQYALGNIALLKAQQENDSRLFIEAEQRFGQVINQYNDTNDQNIKQLAAAAYFGLGAVYERQQYYTKAIRSYENCVELLDQSTLKSRAEERLTDLKQRVE